MKTQMFPAISMAASLLGAAGYLLNQNVSGGVTPLTSNNLGVTPMPIPEPATLGLFGLGFGTIA